MTPKSKRVSIQFIKGIDETTQPEIRLSRNRNKKTGQAIYKFRHPKSVSDENYKNVHKMYLIDKEGELSTRKINIYILDKNLKEIVSIYSWKTEIDFNRFMRFARRYAEFISLESLES